MSNRKEVTASDPAMSRREIRHIIGIVIAHAVVLELLVESFCRHSFFAAVWFVVSSPLCFLYNCCIVLTTLSLALLFHRKRFVLTLVSAIWLGLAIADFVLTSYRTTPLSAIDFALLKSVWSILLVYLNIPQIILVGLGFLAIVVGLAILFRHSAKTPVKPLLGIFFISICSALTALLSVLLLSTGVLSNQFSNPADSYADNGFPYCFCRSIFDRGIDEPEDYSENKIEQLLNEIDAETDHVPTKTPNIIMVQLESFFDVNNLRKLTYSENPVPVFTALKASYPHGYLTVPALGAGTANTEFEILSGMNLDYFGTGEFPYETVLKKTACETIAYNLKELGYATHAIHNHSATFYDRNLVYANLGFDTFTSIEYMENVETNPIGWAKDSILTPEIQLALDSTEGVDFIHTVSVQGHGKYPREKVGDDYDITVDGIKDEKESIAFQYYINQIHESDQFIGELIQALGAFHEPTVVVFFGDHLPNFEITTQDLLNKNLFETEYVIWSNFELDAEDRDLSAYQLSSYVLSLFNINNGTLNKLHQTYNDSPGYLDALEMFEYDMLYGENDAVDTPYTSTKLQMGVVPITVTGLGHIQDSMLVYGEHFTAASVVYIGGEPQETTFISPSCLRIEALDLDPGSVVTVSQVSDDAVVLSTTPRHYITREELLDTGS